MPFKKDLSAIILAGGKSSRMSGNDKGLILYKGKPSIEYILEQITPICEEIVISANRSLSEYKKYNKPVISDLNKADFNGPVAGIESCLQHIRTDYTLIVPCDMPFLTMDIFNSLYQKIIATQSDVVMASSLLEHQPAVLIVKTELQNSAKEFLLQGKRKLGQWVKEQNFTTVEFTNSENAFKNMNTTLDLDKSC